MLVISLWLCGLLMSPHVSGVHGYLSLIARKSAATWNVLCQFHQWLYDATCKLIYFVLYLLSVASKSGHKTKKHVLIGCQTWRVLPPDIRSLTAVKANCHTKGKYCCLNAFDQGVPLMFHFSQLSGIFLTQKQHTSLHKLFLTSKNSWKEYFAEQKQIDLTTAVYSKLRIFGGKTCRVCTQLEHVFSSRLHTYI